jgi:pimeloyl-[acyl-carrier protein] methyl ester esterase
MASTNDALRVERRGHGPQPLVMVHGWAMHCGLFQPLLEQLETHFSLYLLDLPGHGRNHACNLALEPELVVSAASSQLPKRAIWLGWSLGGLFALAAARQGLTSGLVMLASSACFVRRQDWPHGVEQQVFDDFSRRLEDSTAETLKRFLLLETHGSEHPKALLLEMQHRLAEWPTATRRALREGLELLSQRDERLNTRQLTLPTLWLMGKRDRLAPWQAARDMAEQMPEARVRLLAKAGHAPFITHTNNVAESLLRFADHVEKAGRPR